MELKWVVVIALAVVAIAVIGIRVGLWVSDQRDKKRRRRVVENLEKQDLERKSHE